jgi:hypothetical protein
MNTFTITFRNKLGMLSSLTLKLKMHSVHTVKDWWEEEDTNPSAISISKH